MTSPRRRIVRPARAASPAANHHRADKARTSLELERVGLTRWMSRLKRAFHAIEKGQQRVARLERRIRQLETP